MSSQNKRVEFEEEAKPIQIIEDYEDADALDALPQPEVTEVTYEVRRTDVIYVSKDNYERLKLHHDADVTDVSSRRSIVENRFNLYTNERFKNSHEKIMKYLREHGKIPNYLELGNSSIHGVGVFAAACIKKDTYLGDYQCMIRPAYKTNHNYFMVVTGKDQEPLLMDSSNIKFANWTRFINHADASANVRFEFENYVIRVYATRNINPGDELLNNFGESYLETKSV